MFAGHCVVWPVRALASIEVFRRLIPVMVVSFSLAAVWADTPQSQENGGDAFLRSLGPGFRLVDGGHFEIFTDASHEQVRRLTATAEETMADVMALGVRLKLSYRKPAGKMRVVFFDQWSVFARFAKENGFQVNPLVPGFFDEEANRCCLFNFANSDLILRKRQALGQAIDKLGLLEMSDPASSETTKLRKQIAALRAQIDRVERTITGTVIRHEIAHQVLSNFGFQPRGPASRRWLREGLAMQFETREAINGHRLADVCALTRRAEDFDLRALVGDAKHLGPGAADLTARYSRAWALVHFLISRHAAAFRDYLKAPSRAGGDAPSGPAEPETFERAFGKLDDSFALRLHAYVQSLDGTGPPSPRIEE